MSERLHSIGALAKATDTNVETIRYYERIELLPKPERTSANYRAYGQDELVRLSFIRRARELGFTIEQIRALLDLANSRDNDCCTVDALAQAHLAEIESKLSDLRALRRELRDLIGQCQRGKIADCQILAALSPR